MVLEIPEKFDGETKQEANQPKKGIFIGTGQSIVLNPDNTMVANGDVILEDLMLDIEKENANMAQPSFDDTMEQAILADRRNPMSASTRNSEKVEKAKVNLKDNMLKYQISDDKEENDLLEGVMGPS